MNATAHSRASHDARCHVCGGPLRGGVDEGLVLDGGVSSDCQPVAGVSSFYWCEACFTVQPAVDEHWRRETAEIYDSYNTYAAAGGAEQMSADRADGALSRRSDLICSHLFRSGVLGAVGSLLDVGCGRGAFLEAFGRVFPGVSLHGFEIDDRNRGAVQSVGEGAAFHTGNLQEIGVRVDVLSLVHVLEHIENPVRFLHELKRLCAPGASLIVQVPAWQENPFALTIRDHATHFTVASLRRVVEAAGWRSRIGPCAWVAKELSFVATCESEACELPLSVADDSAVLDLQRSVAWLRQVVATAKTLAVESAKFGVFGTAVAGTFVSAPLVDRIGFFVDEDSSRIGGKHLGRPILSPVDVEHDADVYVPLAPVVASKVRERLAGVCRGRIHGAPAFAQSV